MSQITFNVQLLSRLINFNSNASVQQQKAFHVSIFESTCSHVFRCVFGFDKTVDVMHCHCHILVWIVKQCCAVFASSEASLLSTDQVHKIKLPDVGSILSSIHALDQSANFVFTYFCPSSAGSPIYIGVYIIDRCMYDSLGFSLEMCSTDVRVSQLQWFPFVRHTHRQHV